MTLKLTYEMQKKIKDTDLYCERTKRNVAAYNGYCRAGEPYGKNERGCQRWIKEQGLDWWPLPWPEEFNALIELGIDAHVILGLHREGCGTYDDNG